MVGEHILGDQKGEMLSSRYRPRLGVSLILGNVGIVISSRNKS